MLEINDLKKNFENGSPALKGVNLKINKGEFVSILGPSGSGKTTLLRIINGLETSTGGEIYFDNEKIDNNNIPKIQKKTGMIFQEFNLVNNLSAINNVLTGYFNTERLKQLNSKKAEKLGINISKIEDKIKDTIPMKRFGNPEEYANLVCFLASEKSDYITGINIPIDGGFLK